MKLKKAAKLLKKHQKNRLGKDEKPNFDELTRAINLILYTLELTEDDRRKI